MSIRKRESKKAKNGFIYEVYFRYEENGVSKRYSKSGFVTKKEAQMHEIMKLAEIKENGKLSAEIKKTLNEVFEEFIEVGSSQYQPTTIHDTKVLYRYIRYTLGDKLINQIEFADIQRFFNKRKDKGIETNKNIKKALNRIFIYALKVGYIKSNLVSLVTVVGKENHYNHNEVLEFNEFIKLINAIESKNTFKYNSYSIAIQIAYFTGLRISEVLALEKDDFNFVDDLIYVNKKLIYSGLKKSEFYVYDKMKTNKSKAFIPLATALKKNLLEWFEINPYDKVVCDINGMFINPNTLSIDVKKIAKTIDIEFHFHMLRHTFATTLVTNNVDLKTAQELMRHSNINTTMSIYTHINDEHKKKTVNDIFNSFDVELTSKTNLQ
ncbi:MAG: tyrosine-type recombinase/integrase [Longibaculum sp.]